MVLRNCRSGTAAPAQPPRCVGQELRQRHFFSLQALRPFFHDERYTGALIEGSITACRNRGKMDKNVLPVFALNKPETLACVKPLHCTCFFHVSLSCDLILIIGVRMTQRRKRTFEVNLQTEPNYAQRFCDLLTIPRNRATGKGVSSAIP